MTTRTQSRAWAFAVLGIQTYLALGDKFSALNEYNILKDKTTEFAKNLLDRIEKTK